MDCFALAASIILTGSIISPKQKLAVFQTSNGCSSDVVSVGGMALDGLLLIGLKKGRVATFKCDGVIFSKSYLFTSSDECGRGRYDEYHEEEVKYPEPDHSISESLESLSDISE